MSIFAMDPGITKIGISVLSDRGELLYYKLHSPEKQSGGVNEVLIKQLFQLMGEFEELFNEYEVDRVVSELVPSFGRMGQQSRILGVQNLLRVLAMKNSLLYAEIAPRSMKKKFTGSDKATKDHVKARVIEYFPELEKSEATYDVFDSIAIGLLGLDFAKEDFHDFRSKGE